MCIFRVGGVGVLLKGLVKDPLGRAIGEGVRGPIKLCLMLIDQDN